MSLLPTPKPSLLFSKLNITSSFTRCSQDTASGVSTLSAAPKLRSSQRADRRRKPAPRVLENMPSLQTGDVKMQKPAQGQLPEGLESCWADFPTAVLFCLWTFQSPASQSQLFPGPPQGLRGVVLGKSFFHTRVLCLSSVHHIYSNECAKGPVKLRSYTR